MNVQTQFRRLLQLNRLAKLSPCRRYTTLNLHTSRPVCERTCRPISRFATHSRQIGHTSQQEGASEAKAMETSLNWKVLGGIGLTGLVLHTWLLSETYVLDAQLAPAEAGRLDPATSIKFPTSLKLDGESKMTLLGIGVRKVSFLGMKVYSVGFYADLSKVDNKALRQCKSPEECIDLLIQTTSCALRIVPTRATSYTHLRDAFIRTIQARQALRRKDGSLTTEREEALHTPIQQLKGFFPTAAFKKHEPLHIIISPPTAKPRELQFYQLGTVRDDWLATEFFLAYFTGTISPPLIEDVKENVEAIWLPNLRV
ncbi:chalcone-flavanone isomerase-domain-containing protein [Rhizoctonia solani]|nr:chalcone-flavanone isomerase-domain-containing protein [Rhizoctonia solani]